MKRSSRRLRPSRKSKRKFGFTLIELLVVIGIIAILAGVLFPAGTAAIKAAKRARAQATINQIQTSVLAYYTEYSVYPVPSGLASGTDYLITDGANNGTDGADGTDWTYLLYALQGNVNPYNGSITAPTATSSGTISNTRSIAFLNLKSSDCYTSTSYGGIVGPPQNPLPASSTYSTTSCSYYNIAINSSYSGVLGTTTPTGTYMPNFASSTTGSIVIGGTSTAGVALWANCNGTTTSTSLNPAFYVHTY